NFESSLSKSRKGLKKKSTKLEDYTAAKNLIRIRWEKFCHSLKKSMLEAKTVSNMGDIDRLSFDILVDSGLAWFDDITESYVMVDHIKAISFILLVQISKDLSKVSDLIL